MKSRGISGFGVIVLIIILLLFGYVVYQISRVHLTHSSIKEKVEHAARTGYAMGDNEIINQLVNEAKEAHVELNPDSVFIDRTVNDSLRIYVAYDDSSDIFGIYTYSKHYNIDYIAPIEIRF
jgi:type III secretion system FlhB-like substrate exporter